MKFKIGDKVKQKNTHAQRVGIIIDIWKDDYYVKDNEGESILYACKGEYKVCFDYLNSKKSYQTFSEQELEKIIGITE